MKGNLFRRLRLKFIIISMSMLILFLGTVCIAVYTAMSYSLSGRSEAVLDYTAELIRGDHYLQETTPSDTPPAADRKPIALPGYYHSPTGEDSARKQSWA